MAVAVAAGGIEAPGLGAIPAKLGDLLRIAFEESQAAQVIVDPDGVIRAVNRRARSLFGLIADPAETTLDHVQISLRRVRLRTLVEEVIAGGAAVLVHDVQTVTAVGEREWLDLSVIPVPLGDRIGAIVTCTAVGSHKSARDDLARSEHRLDLSQQELEDAHQQLRSTLDVLEKTTEELASTSAELRASNRELQATREELQSMDEELRSANVELETAGGTMRRQRLALEDAEELLDSVLAGVRNEVIVLDDEMRVRTWNAAAAERWGLRSGEVVDADFWDSGIGFAVDELRSSVSDVVRGSSKGASIEVAAVDGWGRSVRCVVTVSPLRAQAELVGAILVVDGRRG